VCARLIEKGRKIQIEVVHTRYPLKVAVKWVTPMEYYSREKVRDLIDSSNFMVDGIKAYLKRTT